MHIYDWRLVKHNKTATLTSVRKRHKYLKKWEATSCQDFIVLIPDFHIYIDYGNGLTRWRNGAKPIFRWDIMLLKAAHPFFSNLRQIVHRLQTSHIWRRVLPKVKTSNECSVLYFRSLWLRLIWASSLSKYRINFVDTELTFYQ